MAPHLLDLPDSLLMHTLVVAGRSAAGAACSTCRALHQLGASDKLWQVMYRVRFGGVVEGGLAERLGSFREVCRIFKQVDLLPGLYLSLSDFPWGQLVAVRLDALSGRLVGEMLHISIGDDRATVTPGEPLFFCDLMHVRRGAHGIRTSVRGRPGQLMHSQSHSAAERALVRECAPVQPPSDVEKLRPWLASLQSVLRLFHTVWPPAHTVRLHAADLLLVAFETAAATRAAAHPGDAPEAPPPPPPPPGQFAAGVAAGNADDNAEVEAAAPGVPSAGPSRSTAWLLEQLDAQWRRRPCHVWRAAGAEDAEPSPFLCLGRLRDPPGGEWPRWPHALRAARRSARAPLAPAALPRLGLYAADYGAHLGERRVEIVQLRAERLAAHALGDGWGLAAGEVEAGCWYLLAIKVCGDCHVPQGATAFAVQLTDKLGALVVPDADASESEALPLARLDGRGAAEAAAQGEAGARRTRWRARSCLAYPGFYGRSFSLGCLEVSSARRVLEAERAWYHATPRDTAEPGDEADATVFDFVWPDGMRHRYFRLGVDDSAYACVLDGSTRAASSRLQSQLSRSGARHLSAI